MTDQRNLLLAIVVSIAILLAFQTIFPPAPVPQQEPDHAVDAPAGAERGLPPVPDTAPARDDTGLPVVDAVSPVQTPRLAINPDREQPTIRGSIALRGARFDDIILPLHRETVDPDSPPIKLLLPVGSAAPYFAEFGWLSATGDKSGLPTAETVWQADGDRLAPDRPVTLNWQSEAGLAFSRRISVDDRYMFTVARTVTNRSDQPVTLYPYGMVRRTGHPELFGFYILHEGPLGVLNGVLEEHDYDDLVEDGPIELQSQGGWLGITDKYWLAAIIPEQDQTVDTRFVALPRPVGQHQYQVDYRRGALTVAPGESVTITDRLFAGAKRVAMLDDYGERLGIPNFDKAVDFGWFYWLTKPLFHVLHYFAELLGNFGLSILLVTVFIKILFFPLANKSYKAMSKLKLLQPKMMELRERFGDDRQRLNTEMMALYKKEGANPLAGCLPILVQIPVFFALYKVLFVTLEMRHAPFYGWVNDLSARDPTSLFNLFGLVPWQPPDFLMIGIWPLLMGLTMWLQQKLNPTPPDPIQAKVMMALPVVFTFLFATFPAGLVIYWTWNNVLSIAQQWVIMRRMGVKV